jgi:2-keto-4-pentenoate hydratase/2-oxohepta-3-ene-1,7-dioic acid hydratase in catechol pathway
MTFKFACKDGRSHLVVGPNNNIVDLEKASNGRFSSEPIEAFRRWAEVREFAATCNDPGTSCSTDELNAPSPWPSQVFGIGLNYRKHAEESGAEIPTSPLTFTKFPSSVGNPNADVPIVGGAVDWEVELVVVIADGGRDINEADAWNHVAGVCIGQDISDRALQMATKPPQFNLGKSRRNYSPFGPWLVDAKDLANRDRLEVVCTLNGTEVQREFSDDLIFNVPQIIAYLSGIVQLLPGDVIFTGTPGGVGAARKPPVFLKPGDVLESHLTGLAHTINRCV